MVASRLRLKVTIPPMVRRVQLPYLSLFWLLVLLVVRWLVLLLMRWVVRLHLVQWLHPRQRVHFLLLLRRCFRLVLLVHVMMRLALQSTVASWLSVHLVLQMSLDLLSLVLFVRRLRLLLLHSSVLSFVGLLLYLMRLQMSMPR